MIQKTCENRLAKWGAVVFVPGGKTWQRWGVSHPLGDDWFYSRDLEPNKWTRQQTLDVIDRVPAAVVRDSKMVGTPDEVADQIKGYVDAGANYVRVGNYVSIVHDGSFGTSGAKRSNFTIETMAALRAKLGLGPVRSAHLELRALGA